MSMAELEASAPGSTISPYTRAARRILTFPAAIGALLAVLAVLTVRSRFDDPDMWWHLKTGEIIWTTHSIPVVDLYSYTTNHHAWVPHEWLAQCVIYGAYRLAGYSGLMLWLCFFSSVLLITGYTFCSLYSGNPKVALLGAIVIWLFSMAELAVRPQMIGYLLLIIELLLIHFGRTRNPHWFWALPPLFAIWVNCHGSFFLGILVAGAFLGCSFFNFEHGLLACSAWDRRQRQTLALALLLSIAVLFLNPDGAKLVFYPLNTMLKQPLSLRAVEEWQPLELGDGRGLAFLSIIGCIFLLPIVQRSKLFLHELLMLVLGVWLAASHRRMLFVFGILVAPILSRLLSSAWENYDPEQDRPWANAFLIVASALVIFWVFPDRHSLDLQVEAASPVRAVEFIEAHHLSGNMLNEYVYGGYLIWAAPDHPVFLDGRGDVFEWTGVLADFGQWALLQSDPNTLLNKYSVDFCLLAQGSPMTHVLPLLPGWKSVYSDNLSEIFVRTGSNPQLQ
jgi:hypothetical protein